MPRFVRRELLSLRGTQPWDRFNPTPSGSTTTTYTFDVNGNQTNVAVGASTTTFTFDKENRLIADSSQSMTYYSNGLLRTKDKAFGQVIELWDGQDLLLAQDADQPTEFSRFGLVDGQVIYSNYGGSYREDFLVDYLGSVTGTTFDDGSGSSYTRYKPYGGTYLGATTQFYGWTGQSGSQVMGITFAEQYNRSRFISLRLMRYATATSDLRSPYIVASPLSQPSPFGDGANSYIGPLNSGPNTLKIYRLPGSDIKCGNIGFRTGFLPQTEPNFTGGVIQLVTKMLFAIDCKRKLILIELKRYLEVWPIKNGKWVDIQMNGEDMFALQSPSECTKGLLLTQGIAGLYRFDHKLLSDWIPPHGVEKLLTSNNLSIFKGGTTFKELAFAWDCCSFLENWEFRAKCGPDENYANGLTRIKEGDPCCE